MNIIEQDEFDKLIFEKKPQECKHPNVVRITYLGSHIDYGCMVCGMMHTNKQAFENTWRGESSKENLTKQIVEISAKTALSAVPIGGTLITEIWNALKDNAFQKRLSDWQNKVEERLCTLEISLEDVGTNEAFASAMLYAAEIAIKTEQEEKREYLANAVYNSLVVGIDENIQIIFMDLISKYSVWHIQVLEYFRDPRKQVKVFDEDSMGSPLSLFFETHPELRNHEALIGKIINDLTADGLMGTANLSTMMTSRGRLASRTTDLGNQFLDYISACSV